MKKKTKILLVNPACLDERITGDDARIVPIGLFYIGAQLRAEGYQTDILNLALADKADSPDPVKRFSQVLTQTMPDVIGFSVTNPNRWNAIDCAVLAKKILPDTLVVFGGAAPTFLAEHLLKTCPALDVIVAGEGEKSFLEVTARVETGQCDSLESVSGLIIRKGGELFQTPDRDPIQDLDSLVHPSLYYTFQHLSMSRGCPGKCTFCGSPKFWKNRQVRFHSPEWIAQEMETLAQKGLTHFFISDDTFTMDKDRVIELCRLLTEKKRPITWNAISRVDYIDADLLFAMRKAGCIQISFGVESGSEQIRKRLGKPIDRDKIVKAFRLTASYGILPRAYFIYGSPGETDATIDESIALLKEIQPLETIFYMLVIFPGTHLYRSAVQNGLVSDDVWQNRIEDLPWFEIDPTLDFTSVKAFGDRLRSEFYGSLDRFAREIELLDINELFPFHADFLSRLALTFSHGAYARDTRVKNQETTAEHLFRRALTYYPDMRSFLGLAMLFQKQRKFESAVEILDKGLARWPDSRDLNICLGVTLMNMGRFEKAEAVFKPFDQFPETKAYMDICRQHLTRMPK